MVLASEFLVQFLKQFSSRKKAVRQFLDGCTFQTFGGMLRKRSLRNAIYIDRFLKQYLMDLPSGLLVEFLKQFSSRKKVMRQLFDEFTFQTFDGIFEAIFYEKKAVHQFF